MTKIDWYILRKFMSTFFFTVLIFTMITVIIDFSEKVEKFIESDITKSEIIFGYFPNFIMFIYGLLFPLFTLISVVFFTSRLANNSEILSIFNAVLPGNDTVRLTVDGRGRDRRRLCQVIGPAVVGIPDLLAIQ